MKKVIVFLTVVLLITGILLSSPSHQSRSTLSSTLKHKIVSEPWLLQTEDTTLEKYQADVTKSYKSIHWLLDVKTKQFLSTIPQALFPAAHGASANRPNIIFILTDDQPPSTLGILGNSVIKTPNIDSLGNPGYLFKNTYSPEGICSPSRASIWTGKLPHIHGVTSVSMPLPSDQLTFPEILQSNGYNTAFIGKCHLGDPTDPQIYTRGFDYRIITLPDDGTVPDWYNYDILKNGIPEHQTEYVTDYLTDQAVTYISEKSQEYKTTGKPFFLWLAHPAPHTPTTPKTGSNRYSLDQIQLSGSITDDLSTKPPVQAATKMHAWYNQLGSDGVRAKLKDAYEVISTLDDNVGRITSLLQTQGIKNDTIIVYMTDNGLFYGEHQLFQKGPYFYDEQVKTPMLFSYPKLLTQKKVSDTLVSNMDIMPTLLELASITSPTNIQGKSFVPLLTGTSTVQRSSLYFEYPAQAGCLTYPMRGVIMNNYKLVHYYKGTYRSSQCPDTFDNGISYDGYDYELYDLLHDPLETNNILKRSSTADNALERMMYDAVYGATIRKLRKELAIWATNTSDPSRFTLSQANVTSLSSSSLLVSWTIASGNPTAEIEYHEKNCSTCPILELNDFSHTSREYTYTLTNLKPSTTYSIRVFSIGEQGIGGYIDIEGRTASLYPEDINNDSVVNAFDFQSFLIQSSSFDSSIDFNNDGIVNFLDQELLIQKWGNN